MVALVVLSWGGPLGCVVHTGEAPPPRQAPGSAAADDPSSSPASTSPRAPAADPEHTALHTSVAASVATVRGLVQAVGAAVRDRSLGLGPRASRAHAAAAPLAQDARRALLGGDYRRARADVERAEQAVVPAVAELMDRPELPAPVTRLLQQQGRESQTSVTRATTALRATGNLAGLAEFDRASASFAGATDAATAGDGRGALRSLTSGLGQLDQGIVTRFPALRAP